MVSRAGEVGNTPRPRPATWRRRLLCALGMVALYATGLRAGETLLFEELFEDTEWTSRGWYDAPSMIITAAEHAPGSVHSCVWHWKGAGDTNTEGGGARVRFAPVTNVILSYDMKHSADWEWTGRGWHPHEFFFLTDVDAAYVAPAFTHLTLYVEVVDGALRVAMQDGGNIDQGRIGQDLVDITEARAVASCNGAADKYGEGSCYRVGEVYTNGRHWDAERVRLSEAPGPYYKGDWHHVRVKLQLNHVVHGVGLRDGVLQYWLDDELLMDYHDVVFRTGQHPDMKINQLLMAPYFGPGVRHPQTIWIDDLRIHTETASPDGATRVDGSDSTWGQVKTQPR